MAGVGYCNCPKKPPVGAGPEGAAPESDATDFASAAGGDFEFGANVERNLGGVVIDEVADAVVGDAAEF
jgi:hypothetical protein